MIQGLPFLFPIFKKMGRNKNPISSVYSDVDNWHSILHLSTMVANSTIA